MIPFPLQLAVENLPIQFEPVQSSLLHFDGADTSTTFTDESGKIWTPNGNAQLSTAWSAFGTASGSFDGTGDFISTPAHSDFEFGGGPFVIESVIRLASNTVFSIASQWSATTALRAWALFSASNVLTFRIYDGTTQIDSTAVWVPTINTDYRVAVERDELNTLRIMVNGAVFTAVRRVETINVSTADVLIGSTGGLAVNMNGKIDELRITKGGFHYGGKYTVAASAFP